MPADVTEIAIHSRGKMFKFPASVLYAVYVPISETHFSRTVNNPGLIHVHALHLIGAVSYVRPSKACATINKIRMIYYLATM